MLWLIAAVAAANAAPPQARPPAPVAVQASATVRIISGVRIDFDSATNPGAPPAHDARITTDGTTQPARLIEFE